MTKTTYVPSYCYDYVAGPDPIKVEDGIACKSPRWPDNEIKHNQAGFHERCLNLRSWDEVARVLRLRASCWLVHFTPSEITYSPSPPMNDRRVLTERIYARTRAIKRSRAHGEAT